MTDDMSATEAAKRLLRILRNDRKRLQKIDDYIHGNHAEPYMPDGADEEYRLLAQRSVSNRMGLLISTPAQALYVDDYRTLSERTPGGEIKDSERITPAWDHFERSRLQSRQNALYRSVFGYGHAFLLAEKNDDGKAFARLLSPLRTAALYEDAANDINALWALHVVRWPKRASSESGEDNPPIRGEARLWDETTEYKVTWETEGDPSATEIGPHGAAWNPVTRFAFDIDLEGRTQGLVEPMIVLQDRINQTVFDLLVAQTGGSFHTRWATGMAPPVERDAEGNPILDENGRMIPIPFQVNGKTFLMNESPDGKFGYIPGTPLDGYIKAAESALQEWASTSQTPPHHMLGQIANLSADALKAAESSFSRKVEEFRHAFAECWERHFRVVASIEGTEGMDDWHGEVVWRDMESRSLHHAADGLSKLADLEIPKRGLWRRVPGVTATELREWDEYWEQENADALWTDQALPSSGSRTQQLREAAERETEVA